MSFSSGTFTLVAGNPVVTATTISSTWANNTLSDIATGLTTCILKDGTQTTTAAIPFAFGITIPTGKNITGTGTAGITGFASVSTTALTVNSNTVASSQLTEKVGSGSGNYTTNSTSYVDVDGTNLAFTITIPTGYKLLLLASATVQGSSAAGCTLSFLDGVTTLAEAPIDTSPTGIDMRIAMNQIIAGDGAAHTIKLQWKVGAGTATMRNASAGVAPRVDFLLSTTY